MQPIDPRPLSLEGTVMTLARRFVEDPQLHGLPSASSSAFIKAAALASCLCHLLPLIGEMFGRRTSARRALRRNGR
jgi:hypothetical protein